MQDILNKLDHALDMGKRELAFLEAGELEEAEKLAYSRGELLRQALEGEKGEKAQDKLFEKLKQLQAMHGRITAEAVKIHARLKGELIAMRKQNQCFRGYKEGASVAPLVQNRFVSKKG